MPSPPARILTAKLTAYRVPLRFQQLPGINTGAILTCDN